MLPARHNAIMATGPRLLLDYTGTLTMLALTAFLAVLMVSGDDPSTRISDAQRDDRGTLVHSVQSDYQAGTTKLRVLLPSSLDSEQRYPVVYVLPVEAAEDHEYGDGLAEVQKRNLHNQYQAIFVDEIFATQDSFEPYAIARWSSCCSKLPE